MTERTSVIVTGGSSGIGLATARLYAARGCDVALVGRSADKLAAARRSCAASPAPTASAS